MLVTLGLIYAHSQERAADPGRHGGRRRRSGRSSPGGWQMTQMPELVAAMHSLVGLAAVFIAIAAVNNPEAMGLHVAAHRPAQGGAFHRHVHRRDHLLRLGHRLRQAVRQDPQRADRVQGPALRQSRHRHRHDRLRHLASSWHRGGRVAAVHRHDGARVPARLPVDHSHRRRRHAGGDLDAQQLLGLGGGGHRLFARQSDADHRRLAGRLLRRDPVLHHVQGDEPLVLQRDSRRLRRRDRRGGRRRGEEDREERQRRRCRVPALQRRDGDHRSRLRPGGGARAARGEGAGGQAHREGRDREIRDSPGGRAHAGPHERAARRSRSALRPGVRDGGHQRRVRAGRRGADPGRQRRRQSAGRAEGQPDLRHADHRGVQGEERASSTSARWPPATPASTIRCSTWTRR